MKDGKVVDREWGVCGVDWVWQDTKPDRDSRGHRSGCNRHVPVTPPDHKHVFEYTPVSTTLLGRYVHYEYVCRCGQVDPPMPWPCLDGDGRIEDRAAGIPTGEM